MDADPTNNLIWSLDNEPDKWKRTSGVAVFRAHELEFLMPDGKRELRKVTDKDLEKIANDANETIKQSGKVPTFTLGHRQFGKVDESKQPELIGFHVNFRAEDVTRNGETFKALVADECAAVDKAKQHEIYRKFPFRSGEYHPALGFTGVAALQQEPRLSLGTNYQYATGVIPVCYQSEAIPMNDQTAGQAAQPGGEAVDPEQYAAWMKCMQQYMATANAAKPAAAAPASAAPAAPAAPRPAGYQADQGNAVDAKVAELQNKIADLQKKNVESTCKQLLQPITQAYQFDHGRELAIMTAYQTDAERIAHVEYITKNYAKLPGGEMISLYQGAVRPQGLTQGEPEETLFTPPKGFAEITAYMMAHPGMSYDAAELAVKALPKAA